MLSPSARLLPLPSLAFCPAPPRALLLRSSPLRRPPGGGLLSRPTTPSPYASPRSRLPPQPARASLLQPGTELDGEVTRLADYGAFVSIPPHGSGLVHISEISHAFVSDVSAHVQVGQHVRVRVLSAEGGRIALSLKKDEEESRGGGYDRVVQLGGDWGDAWGEDGESTWKELGESKVRTYAWEADPDLFADFGEQCMTE